MEAGPGSGRKCRGRGGESGHHGGMASITVLAIVFLFIAVRQVGKLRLQIWQIMLLGALTVLLTREISPSQALAAINLDVMLFLFGMFVVGEAMEESGYLSYLTSQVFRRAKSLDGLVLLALFGIGAASALLMNDTLAIVGTPVMLIIARKTGTQPKLLLLTLAFAVTIGSVMSPIGNPQNLLVAVNGGVANPFVTFFKFLVVPTLINLVVTYLLLRVYFRSHFRNGNGFTNGFATDSDGPIKDTHLARLSRASLVLIIVLVVAKIAIVFMGLDIDFRLTYIALAAAFPILLLSHRRFEVLRGVDWYTLIFFAAMFVLMESVWESGFFQSVMDGMHLNMISVSVILSVSVALSQLISNVPLVALYLPVLLQLGASTREIMALAAGSTIAGNLTILGAASNIIIIQNAEKKADETITFWDFVRIGLPLTALNVAVYWLFLAVL